jgi:hypothetical protein
MNVAMRRVAVSSFGILLLMPSVWAAVPICSCNADAVSVMLGAAFSSNVAISSRLPVGATAATHSWNGVAVLSSLFVVPVFLS